VPAWHAFFTVLDEPSEFLPSAKACNPGCSWILTGDEQSVVEAVSVKSADGGKKVLKTLAAALLQRFDESLAGPFDDLFDLF
jgi:hypothetical protein